MRVTVTGYRAESLLMALLTSEDDLQLQSSLEQLKFV